MAGADNIVFNTREKPISQDMNDLQALDARTLASILRFATMSRLSGLGTANDTEVINPQCNGLQVIPNGSDVLIKPGYLLQESATISPVPGALDSPYRIALNHANMAPTAVAPSPVADTYYLLEAQVVETTTLTESRSVLNPSTGNFVSTSVAKRKERRLVTAWRTGAANAYPLPTGGDWVVLAGVFRPAGGGAVLQSHIQDMRLQPDLLIGEAHIDRATRAQVSRVSVTSDNDSLVHISADADVWTGASTNRGLRLHMRNLLGVSTGFTPSSAAILSPTTTLASTEWYYLYLAPWAGLAPRTYFATVGASRGVPVLSHIPPTAFSSGNSAAIDLPAPFGGVQALAGTACCIAILRRNAANNGWRAVQGAGDSYRLAGVGPTLMTDTGTFPGVMNVVEPELPRARLIRIAIHMAITLTGTTSAEAYLKFVTSITGSSDELNAQRIPLPGASTTTRWDFELDVPYSSTGYDFTLTLVAASGTLTAASGVFNAYCAGWTL
jgi:hypothetical protein